MRSTSKRRRSSAQIPSTTRPVANEALTHKALDTADDAALLDDFASVQQLVTLAESAANKTHNLPFVTSIQQRVLDLRSLVADYPKVQKALTKLEASTADTDAHLLVGRFYAAPQRPVVHRPPASCRLQRRHAPLLSPYPGPRPSHRRPPAGATRRRLVGLCRKVDARQAPPASIPKPTRADGIASPSPTSPASPSRASRPACSGAPARPAAATLLFRRAPSSSTINLLPLTDPAKDTLEGKWTFANGTLQCATPRATPFSLFRTIPPTNTTSTSPSPAPTARGASPHPPPRTTNHSTSRSTSRAKGRLRTGRQQNRQGQPHRPAGS